MADLPSTARVVIIGGGVVGASSLYHLALKGWTDCVLLEKNELTSGSTWHAAGNVPTFSASWGIMNIQRYSTELYRRLGAEVDYPMNYHVTGSVRLAHSKNRMMEFERAAGMGRYQGMALDICSVDELKDHYPFLETHDLEGGLFDPSDGDIDPAQLTQALAKGARDMGAQIIRYCPATGVRRERGEWLVQTPHGDIRCEAVVNAAGYRAREIGRWFGRDIPMVAMSHQYMLTDPIPAIEQWTAEHGRKLPLLRDVDSSYYLRQEKTGLNLGPYERHCRAHWVSAEDPMPEDFSFQLFPDDLERLEWYIEDAMARVPLLAEGGISRVINGPIPYLPDGNPAIGPMPGVRNAYEACVFTFGIAQGGGAGKVLAEWIVEGGTEWDMWAVDPRRFTHAPHDYAVAKAKEIYGHEYAMHFPYYEWPDGRPLKTSPLYDTLQAAGAQFGVYGCWERANWFARPDDDTSLEAAETWEREGPWRQRVQAECEAVRDHCGILEICGFSRYKVEGPGALAFVDGLTCSRLPKPGRIGLAYFPDERGRIVTEMSVMVHDENDVGLITAAAAEWHDAEQLWRRAPEGITVSTHSDEVDCLLVTGPKARELLEGLTDADLSKPWLSVQHGVRVAGEEAALIRVSFAGELGWEIHTAPDSALPVYQAMTEAGAQPFGMYALNSLRIEKGYRAWKGDLSTDYSLLEAGLERFIHWDKPTFPGKAALEKERQEGPKKRFAPLIVEANACDAPYMSTVWKDGEIIGETTSGDWGYRVGQSIALAMLRSDCSAAGTPVEVDIYGTRCPAVVQSDRPLWDPDNQRLKA